MADDITDQLAGAFKWGRKYLPPIPGINPDPVGALTEKLSELTTMVGAPETGKDIGRFGNIVSGHTAQTATDIAGTPTGLYTLANMGVNAARSRTLDEIVNDQKDYSKPQLPGAQGALEITEGINKFGSQIGSNIAGEPIESMEILKPIENMSADPLGNSARLVGTLARITGGLIPAPQAAAAKYASLLGKIDMGSKVINATTVGAIKALEFATPITLQPTKVGYAANAAVGGGIVAGLEKITQDDPQVAQAIAQTSDEIVQAHNEAKTIKAGTLVQAGMLPTTGDWKVDAGVAAGVGGLTLAAILLRRSINAQHAALQTPGQWDQTDVLAKSTKLDAMLSDRIAPLRATSTDPLFGAYADRRFNDASISTQIEHSLKEGDLPDGAVSSSGPVQAIKITPQREVDDMVAGLGTPQRQDDLKKVLNYRTEIDNRATNFLDMHPKLSPHLKHQTVNGQWGYNTNALRGWANNITTSHMDRNIAVNYHGGPAQGPGFVSTRDMMREIDRIMADQDIAKIVGKLDTDYRSLTQYVENQTLRSKQEANRFRSTNIQYSPTDRDYGTNLWERTRKAGEGLNVMGDPIAQRRSYIESVIDQAMKGRVRQRFLEEMHTRKNAGDAKAADILGDQISRIETKLDKNNNLTTKIVRGSRNEYNADHTITWRDSKGEQVTDVIKDPIVRAALRGESLHEVNTLMHLIDYSRRWSQIVKTGALTLTNSFFAPKAAIMTGMYGMAKKPKDMRGGPLDRITQYLSGGKIDLPGDPSFVLDLPRAMISDASSQLAEALYHSMSRSITTDGMWAKMLGPNHAQLVADTAKKFWDESVQHKMRELGVGGAAPITDNTEYMKYVKSNVQSLGALGATKEALMSTFEVAQRIHNIISASAISSMVRNNMGRVTDDRLAQMARQFAADPGKRGLAPKAYQTQKARGASGAYHMANTAIPYMNISMQTFADIGRVFKSSPENAARLVTGITIGVGLPGLIAVSHNVAQGPEYVDYQFNKRTAEQAAQNIYIAVPGMPPEYGLEFPVETTFRPFHVMFTTLSGALYGLFDGSIFKPDNDFVKMRMQELAAPRFKQQLNEALNMTFGLPLPLPLALGVAAKGHVPGEISPFKPLWRDAGEHRMSGFDDERGSRFINDNVFGIQLDRNFDEMQRALLASFGDQIFDSLRTLTRTGEAGAPMSEGFKDVFQREGMRFKDGAKMFNGLLWSQSPKLTPHGVESKILFEKRDTIRKLTEAYGQDMKGDRSGSRTKPGPPVMGETPMKTDPQMMFLAKLSGDMSKQLDKAYMSPMRSIQDRIVSLESSARYKPSTQRGMINELNRLMQEYQAQALTDIYMFEKRVSKSAGRRIDLSKVDLDKGFDQFPPLTPPQLPQ